MKGRSFKPLQSLLERKFREEVPSARLAKVDHFVCCSFCVCKLVHLTIGGILPFLSSSDLQDLIIPDTIALEAGVVI